MSLIPANGIELPPCAGHGAECHTGAEEDKSTLISEHTLGW